MKITLFTSNQNRHNYLINSQGQPSLFTHCIRSILEINRSYDQFSKIAETNRNTKLSAASDFVDLIDKNILNSLKGGN